MKDFTLKNATSSLLIAGLIGGMIGLANAQTGGSGQGGAASGQGGSTSGQAITGQRNSQGDGTTDTTGKGTGGKDDSYSMSTRKKGGSSGQQGGSGSSNSGSSGSGGSQGSGSTGGGGY